MDVIVIKNISMFNKTNDKAHRLMMIEYALLYSIKQKPMKNFTGFNLL